MTAWVQIGVVALLMVATFRFNLSRLWGRTNPFTGQDDNWQHAVFVPLIGLYYLYLHRDELIKAAGAPVRHEFAIRVLSLIGLALMAVAGVWLMTQGVKEMLFHLLLVGVLGVGMAISALSPTSNTFGSILMIEGLLVFAFGIFPGQNDYLKDLGMVITLFGVTTLLAGWAVMKVAWFPIVFLVVGLPWPELVYSKLAWPLQKLAASAAVGTLRLFGVDAHNYGTRIIYVGVGKDGPEPRMLNVAEACAGLKSVMTFLMVAGTVAFLSARPLWEKLVISLSAIPIAIFCNVVRVAGQGVLDRYVSHEVSQGFAHKFVGLIMVIPGFFIILLVGWVMDKVFIEEVDPEKLKMSRKGGRKVVEVRKPAVAAALAEPTEAATTELSEPGVPLVKQSMAFGPTAVTGDVGTAPAVASAAPVAQPIENVLLPPAKPAAPKAPVAPVAKPPVASPAKPVAPVAKPAAPTVNKPTTPAPAPTPTAPRAASTLKPPTRPAAAPVVQPAASTLKPSSKPAAPRVALPPQGLKPSAKPLAKPQAPAPQAGSTLKPSAKPAPGQAKQNGNGAAGGPSAPQEKP